MNVPCRLRISSETSFANVDMVRAAVGGVCAEYFRLDRGATSVTDFCLMVTELMNNVVEHSEAGILEAEILLSDREAVFCLISAGSGFDPTHSVPMPDVEQAEIPEGGYGLALIQTLADGLEYERRENTNLVTLRKTFPVKAEQEE